MSRTQGAHRSRRGYTILMSLVSQRLSPRRRCFSAERPPNVEDPRSTHVTSRVHYSDIIGVPMFQPLDVNALAWHVSGEDVDCLIFLNVVDPGLLPGSADAPLSSPSYSLFDWQASSERDDEGMLDEVEETKKAAKKRKAKVRPYPLGSTLSDAVSPEEVWDLRGDCAVKPIFPAIPVGIVTAMHKALASRNGDWRRSFSRQRIKRALAAVVIPGKILGQGKGVAYGTPSKRQKVDTSPAAGAARAAPASRDAATSVPLPLVSGLLRGEAYAATKSKTCELFLHLDRLVGDYDEDVRSIDSELCEAGEANAALQSRLDVLVERNGDEDEIALLKSQLTSASDLQNTRVDEAVARAKDEMTHSLEGRVSEVVGLLAEIGGKAQTNMLDLAEFNANLEFIELLQGSKPPDLPTEVKALHHREVSIYEVRDVFADFLTRVRRVLEIPEVSAATVEVVAADEDDDEVDDDEDGDKESDEEIDD
ncbi:hypothetical protein AALP_AAs73797U000100 [Arabis alpina]|uniref:Uncharacterized protein n=1 Tax=Arabis alpina TaxID=50452 RepID=A0A087FZ18_ARAAL|nr:hypothetical protein AALP_AAs73797U000100 [Arabis alpina]